MKTTIHISDSLFEEARRLAQRESTSLRAVVEEGLRMVIADHAKGTEHFRLRKATFRGKGMQPGIEEASWETLRDMSYEGHGG